VAVLREGSARGADSGLRDTLSAFAAHGAVIAANARLLSEVQRSLEAQVEANRRKDAFVATISHELRTPLTVMLGSAQTLMRLDGRLDHADRTRFLQAAIDQGGRLQRLIEDLLLVAAVEQGQVTCELTTIRADELADQLLADLPHELRERVHAQSTAGDATFTSDRNRLRQIIVNLAENAGKYAPSGPIEINLTANEVAFSVAVLDHGPGIPAHDRERVFERFVQLDQSSTRRHGGTGLGLFLCRQLATQLGGTLKLEDTRHGGCTFTLTLPRVPRPGGTTTATSPAIAKPPAGLRRRPALVLAASTTP
jgi:signal transduction histidine kinase